MPPNSAAPTTTSTTTLGEVAFDTPLHGWAAGSTCAVTCVLLFATTDDGGVTWTHAAEVGSVAASANGILATHVRFNGQNGWISGSGIFDTHDGGRTWTNGYGGSIAALEAVGASAWAVTSCASEVGACTPTLLVSTVGTDQWSKASVQPPVKPVASGSPYTGDVTLERSPNNVSFLAYQGQLTVSRDVGRSWQSLASPCPQIAGLRSLDGVNVWLVCSEIVGVHAEASKQAYVSGDGGRTWQLRADNRADVIAGSSRTIPVDGYIDAFVQTAPSVALYGSEFGTGVARTADGGRTWHDIDIGDPCINAGTPVTQLWFVGPLMGWAVGLSTDGGCPALFTSHDGGVTWAVLPSPFTSSALPPSLGSGGTLGYDGGACSFEAVTDHGAGGAVVVTVTIGASTGTTPSSCGGQAGLSGQDGSELTVQGVPLRLPGPGSFTVVWSNWCGVSVGTYFDFVPTLYPTKKPSSCSMTPPSCVDSSKASTLALAGPG